jgi:uncharacterized repeat protein (TIGR03803 family)
MAVLAAPPALAAAQEIILHTFKGRDGQYPSAGLTPDGAGNLYGTTHSFAIDGAGLVFALNKNRNGKYAEKVLYKFGNFPDGLHPNGVIRSKRGALFGTTNSGGQSSSGDVFALAPDGREKELYAFTGGSDGRMPISGVIRDKAGNLYGTTIWGGAHNKGVVFKLAKTKGAAYTETVVHSFGEGRDGVQPDAGLMADKAGNLYGTTIVGGRGKCSAGGCGTVYKIAPDGTETVLYDFKGGSDGNYPYAGVIEDSHGNLYGTAYVGGASNNGVVFKLAPDGTETVLYSFAGGSDGAHPYGGVIVDDTGNLYGTTEYGGASNLGTVFSLAPDGTETVLHSFTGGSDGSYPQAGLIADDAGNLYGTTQYGGTGECNPLLPPGCGVVFEIENSQSAAERHFSHHP